MAKIMTYDKETRKPLDFAYDVKSGKFQSGRNPVKFTAQELSKLAKNGKIAPPKFIK